MKTTIHLRALQAAQDKAGIAEVMESVKETCEYCHPLTPIECVRCSIWKLKNALRKLYEKMRNPNFLIDLLNTLKNKRRLHILEILSNGRCSIVRLQRELGKIGYHHSQGTIMEEYINPLMETGLAEEDQNRYHATPFGCKVNELMKDFSDVGELLPPHSKCYEEKSIKALSESPKAYEELGLVVPAESLSRVLKRLQEKNLITKGNEDSYIFYFKTKRNPQQEKLSPTEKRVYENIPEQGITAKKLADKTNISLRRTYKYIRKLRGKKLAFKRKRPSTYTLTTEGTKIAKLLEQIHALLIEFAQASAEFTRNPLEASQQIQVPNIPKGREQPMQILAEFNA